jgi:hypothetical protein
MPGIGFRPRSRRGPWHAKEPKDFTPMIFFSRVGFWKRDAEISNQQIKKSGLKLDVVVPNILKAARYGIDKNDQKVKASYS